MAAGASSGVDGKSVSASGHIQARLAREVLRKLRLAADEAEEKEDRDIICSEVFADITGELSTAARGAAAGWTSSRGRPAFWLPSSESRRPALVAAGASCAALSFLGYLSALTAETTGTIYTRWYEVLAPYFCKVGAGQEGGAGACGGPLF